jgi:hypothetical protein
MLLIAIAASLMRGERFVHTDAAAGPATVAAPEPARS